MAPTPEEVFMNSSTLTKYRDTYAFIDPFRFRNSLTGQIVLITNAHRGIGKASALEFAAAGATVVCVARTAQQLQPIFSELRSRYTTLPSYAFPADLSDPNVPARLINQIEASVGAISILLNVTGATGLTSFPHIENFLDDWWAPVELNLRAPIALIHAVLPSMIARGSGTIITTTFRSGVQHMPFTTADSVAQGAIIRFHHGLDAEVRPKGIFSYAVHPGMIASHLHDPDVRIDNRHFVHEPRLQTEMTGRLAHTMQEGWCSAGLATGTFIALCADPRARVLSGLYLDAQRDLEELICEVEKGEGGRVDKERLYVLKVDEI